MKTVKKIISGGQTGADTGALLAALSHDVVTGGWAPRGYLTEVGPRRAFLQFLELKEHKSDKYPPRTIANITDADFTLIVTDNYKLDGGSAFTRDMCFKLKKPVFHSNIEDALNNKTSFDETVDWILRRNPKPLTINVAGNRESKSPGIQVKTERLISQLLSAIYSLRG